MFSRFLDYIRKGDDDDENRNQQGGKGASTGTCRGHRLFLHPILTFVLFAAATIEDSSSSTTAPETKKRRVREDYRIKYAYLDYVNMIDMRGLECLVSW